MITIKAYTTIEQSRKLAEILPIGSADMYYMETSCNNYTIGVLQRLEKDMLLNKAEYYKMFPCWSLAALLSVLPNYQLQTQDDGIGVLCSCNGKFNIVTADNPVDACYKMILKLHELNLL